jgi:hypothetical protein
MEKAAAVKKTAYSKMYKLENKNDMARTDHGKRQLL